MAVINVTLDWGCVWEIAEDTIPSNIPDVEGIYMVLRVIRSRKNKWDTSYYKLLYIGEAEAVRTRIDGHEKWPHWRRNCRGDNMLLKIAKCNLGTTIRQKIEYCLLYNTKPICNDECKDHFPYKYSTVQITNMGIKSPLNSNYTFKTKMI
jgi:hypothetical protein